MSFTKRPYRQPARSALNHPDATHRNGVPIGDDDSRRIATKPAPRIATKGVQQLWQTLQSKTDTENATSNTTRLLALPQGVVLNTCTRGPAGMCEALVFIPGAKPADFPT
jgi:hypothetical protein